jgi:hypothetical protein
MHSYHMKPIAAVLTPYCLSLVDILPASGALSLHRSNCRAGFTSCGGWAGGQRLITCSTISLMKQASGLAFEDPCPCRSTIPGMERQTRYREWRLGPALSAPSGENLFLNGILKSAL